MSYEKEIRELMEALELKQGDFLGQVIMIAEVFNPEYRGESVIVMSATDDCTRIQQLGLIESAKDLVLNPSNHNHD